MRPLSSSLLLRHATAPWLPAAAGALMILGGVAAELSNPWPGVLVASGGPLVALSIALSVYRRQLADARESRLLALREDLEQTVESLRRPFKDPLRIMLPGHDPVEIRVHLIETPAISEAAKHADLDGASYRNLLKLVGEIAVYNRRVDLLLSSFNGRWVLDDGEVDIFVENLRSWFVGPLAELQEHLLTMMDEVLEVLPSPST